MEQFSPAIFTSVINSYLPEPQASLLNGMIFGIDVNTSKAFYEQLKIVGLLHIVVLSGMNITLLASIVAEVTSYFGRLISTLITILTIIIFIIFVGIKAPIIRAGLMGILTLVSFLYGRKYFALFALFLSLLFIFAFWPSWLKSLSLHLSFGATLGIILFGKSKTRIANNPWEKLVNWVKKELRLSLAAQIFTAPLIFLYFKQVSVISPLTNVLVSFFIAPIMVFGFLTAFLGKIDHWLGLLPSYIAYGLLSYVIFVIKIMSKIPFAYFKF